MKNILITGGFGFLGTPGHSESVLLGMMIVLALGTSGCAAGCLFTLRGRRKQGKDACVNYEVALFGIATLATACMLSFVVWKFAEEVRY